MDTKLKNRHKLAVMLIGLVIFTAALMMSQQYRQAYNRLSNNVQNYKDTVLESREFTDKLAATGCLLYLSEQRKVNPEELLEYSRGIDPQFDLESYEYFFCLLDYRVSDGSGNIIDSAMSESEETSGDSESSTGMTDYGMEAVVSYDSFGECEVETVKNIPQSYYVESLRDVENNSLCNVIFDGAKGYDAGYSLQTSKDTPEDRTYLFAMRQENLETYVWYLYNSESRREEADTWALFRMFAFLAIGVALIAQLLPKWKSLRTGEEKIFTAPPFELPLAVFLILIFVARRMMETVDQHPYGTEPFWVVAFAVVYWCAACLRHLYTLGIKRYVKESHHSLRKFTDSGEKEVRRLSDKCTGYLDRIYHSFSGQSCAGGSEKGFKMKMSFAIFKIVLINFAVLAVIVALWFWGIPLLVLYSGLLFYILRRYAVDLKEKYGVLLNATNQMAEGKLDVEIEADLGVFNPFKEEIRKIQEGYQKAVEKEVKSQRMKTELVTNVSHDLKTPLTAIITYVDLLKSEKDEEKRREYIEVLEKKSQRLKALIEDLFEISKASSKNVTLHLVQVDVVNLFKQVKLELQEKLEDASLEFRMTYPEEKLICWLDSQKTYRIFENLLVNVSKYAMPGTRVYVKMEKTEQDAVIQVLNISAAELSFSADEITERFVRGDASRNTEGSGLGLAIAKSFTELQKGKFYIETEGDLFKARVSFPLYTGEEKETGE